MAARLLSLLIATGVAASAVATAAPAKAAGLGNSGPLASNPYEGVTYERVCGKVGCVNITKKCTDNLKNCGLYWNTEFTSAYKKATGISLNYSIQIGSTVVYGPRDYGHTKNASQKPLFHGSWGFNHPPGQWGQYSYPCYVFGTCTGYLKSSDDVKIGGTGSFKLDGDTKYYTLYGAWDGKKGQAVPWQGVLKWAGLPY